MPSLSSDWGGGLWHVQEGANANAPGLVRKKNKYKHGNHFNIQRKHFSPFVISFDGMLVKESLDILMILIQLMAAKMEEPISTCNAGLTVGFQYQL